MRVIAVVDSDSYVKWGAAVLAALPREWLKSLVLVATPIAPSDAQLQTALAGSGFAASDALRLELPAIVDLVREQQPDVVLLSLRGPVASVVARDIYDVTAKRPVIVSGLPGISVPATRPAIRYRTQADLFLLHSKREVREFRQLAVELEAAQTFALAELPFLQRSVPREVSGRRDVIFAAQSIVPADRVDRVRLLGWLSELATRHPELRVVIKVRAVAGEVQTHEEHDSYPDLLASLGTTPDNLVVASGPMGGYLDQAVGFVTVSSTAAIEALAAGVPVIAVDDFGVGPELINEVFVGSNLLAGSDDLVNARFRTVSDVWLDDNYFHDPADSDWLRVLDELLEARAAGRLPRHEPWLLGRGGEFRRAWERKRALGKYDRSASGRLAGVVWLPVRTGVRAARGVLRWSGVLAKKQV
ncbi:DUF6716 putative glycosyltransferase [Glaciihabitans sp. dw_435]|uniref:DUF6716 putative glycosyltransferase n=1 Tax=Glaciihabitans sp. dw_435 TaxID=2720081 RepID=UPI001BD4BB62|nr:DUF6716 putative glycosyltransferase [Glaciihabitans sp. dw_435]